MAVPLDLLIVEDSAEDIELMLYQLRRAGFEPHYSRAQDEAEYCDQLQKQPQVILADFYLPQFDALGVLRVLRERHLDIPVIVVTGSLSEDLVARCLQGGAADYLVKDRLMRLGQAVNQVLQERELRAAKKRVEADLQRAQDSFLRISERVSERVVDIVYRLRIAPTYAFEYVSASVKTILGYSSEDFYADNTLWVNLIHPDDLPVLVQRLEHKTFLPQVFRIRHRDGTYRLIEALDVPVFDEQGTLVAIEGVARDVTERMRMEEALRRSEAKNRALIDALPDILAVVRADGTILDIKVPKALEDLASSVIGKTTYQMPELYPALSAAWVSGFMQRVQRALDSGEMQVFESAFDIPGFVGLHYEFRLVVSNEQEVLAIVRDVTEARQAQDALLNAELLRAEVKKERELVQLKEDFVSMVSHEFRNPLSVIQSSAELLERYEQRMTPLRRQEHVQRIREQAAFMSQLLDDVLMVSRAKSGKGKFQPKMLNLVQLCGVLLERVALPAANTHHLVFNAVGELEEVWLDENLLQHTLMNLLQNAVKYSPDGGEVRLEVERVGTFVVIKVVDHGIGILPEDMGRLYETFQRGSNTAGIHGTGLGLAIVKANVDLHGGTIHCESAPGVGTTFTVRLPCVP
ncbi:MAG: PAS domain S-box protein [Chloroflexi bacterium]|nr:PAS domain S-box protein [Chloroflexota bacterium]